MQMRGVDAKSWSYGLIYERANPSAGEGELVENACLENDMGQVESRRKSRSRKTLLQPLNRMKIRVLRLPERPKSLEAIC